jgi:hypothetical protein
LSPALPPPPPPLQALHKRPGHTSRRRSPPSHMWVPSPLPSPLLLLPRRHVLQRRAPQLVIIDELVQDAVRAGARVLCGGKRNATLAPGLFYEPTVLVGVKQSMRIVNEEVFGPVMTIIRVENDEECVRLVNATSYGLGSRCAEAEFSALHAHTRFARRLAHTHALGEAPTPPLLLLPAALHPLAHRCVTPLRLKPSCGCEPLSAVRTCALFLLGWCSVCAPASLCAV